MFYFQSPPPLRTIEAAERLGGQPGPGAGQGAGLARRVSRVESLRRLLLGGAGQHEARRMWDRRRQRYTVDKAIGEIIHDVESV